MINQQVFINIINHSSNTIHHYQPSKLQFLSVASPVTVRIATTQLTVRAMSSSPRAGCLEVPQALRDFECMMHEMLGSSLSYCG